MPFKYLNKPLFIAALMTSGGVYVLAKTAWAGLDEAVYMNPFLLLCVYVFYIWLILPFNVKYAFATIRNPDLTEFKLTFVIKLTALAALYEGILAVEIGITGLVICDDFVVGRAVNYLVHLFLNLNLFDILYAALCDKFKAIIARTVTFLLPAVSCMLNHFGGSGLHKFNFLYFGMRSVSVLNAAIVYITVFGGCLLLLLKKGKREYA